MTKNVETAVEAAAVKVANKQISSAIPEPLFAALDDYKWSQKTNMSGLVRVALEEYAAKHNLLPQSA